MKVVLDPAGSINYQLAFEMAPVGLVLSRNRSIVDCNQHLCERSEERRVGKECW